MEAAVRFDQFARSSGMHDVRLLHAIACLATHSQSNDVLCVYVCAQEVNFPSPSPPELSFAISNAKRGRPELEGNGNAFLTQNHNVIIVCRHAGLADDIH